MKIVYLFLIVIFIGISTVFAQKTNLVFFTEQGEGFTLILNGIQQNPEPETNVKVTGLIARNYKAKIIFKDRNLGEIDKNIIFNQGTETTFVIKRNEKGKYVIRWMNEVPIAQALPQNTGQTVVVFNALQQPSTSYTTVTHSQTITTNNQTNINPQTGVNVNMNINANGNNPNTELQTNATTTQSVYQNRNVQQPQSAYVMPGYNGPIGCAYPMSPQEFELVKQSIVSKSFEDSKIKIAKQVINSNCLLCSQVKEIMLLFSFEDTRLELAKYAYGHTYDIGNYYKLNDAFEYESTIDELNDYINGNER